MNTEEIIAKLNDWSRITVMSANEWLDFGVIKEKIEEIAGIEAHGTKEVKSLEELEKLLWYAARQYTERK